MRWLVFFVVCGCPIVSPIFAEEATVAGEAERLFDGETLNGWDGDPRLWSVRDGAIHGETTADVSANGNTFLIWKGGEVSDFELTLKFRCSTTNNSGIQYRSRRVTEGERAKNDWVVIGYQHEIRNENTLPNVSGFIYDEGGSRKRICFVGERAVVTADGKKVLEDDLISQQAFKDLMKLDQWNEVRIVARGSRLRHYLNGTLILDCVDEDPDHRLSSGVIALQLHAGKPMFAEFKDIVLKRLE